MADTWTLTIPAPTQWVSANDRSHWASKARLVKVWRDAGAIHAKAAKLPHIDQPVTITGYVRRTISRRADAHNRILTVKAVIDGLVDAGVFTDDSDKHVVAVTMRAGQPVDRKQHPLGVLELEIRVEEP